MHEKMATALPGTRTSAVQYERSRLVTQRPEERVPLSQCVRQGNQRYPVSPIYQTPAHKDK